MKIPENLRYRGVYVAVAGIVALVLGGWWFQGQPQQEGQEPNTPALAAVDDFSLVVSEPVQKVVPGGIASYEVRITFLNDFNSTNVHPWVRGMPSGVRAHFEPDPIFHQGISVLMLTGDGTEQPGTYPLTVGATAGGMSRTQEVALVVTSAPDFTMAVSPTTQTVAAGKAVTYDITIAPVNGFSQSVELSLVPLPNGISASFARGAAGSSVRVLTVTTTAATVRTHYELVIQAIAGTNVTRTPVFLDVTAPGSVWTVSSIGTTGAKNNTVHVGPARNDGIERVYAGTVETGKIFEFSWDGKKWSEPVLIGGSPAGREIHNMTIGPGRNDGILRLYVGSLDGNLYELTYTHSGWSQSTVGTAGGEVSHAVVGDGRNDGTNRLYAVREKKVWEYTWTGTGWNQVYIGKVAVGVAHGMALGDGRGNGRNHLYVASTGSGVYEAFFSRGVWTLAHMGDTGDIRNVGVGAGRNDGTRHVYGALLAGGRIREFTWDGEKWKFNELTGNIGTGMVHASVLAGRGDGTQRVYTSTANGNVYEFTREGSGWKSHTLGGGKGYMYGFHFGNGRNDGIERLYGGNFNSHVYEYTWSAP